MKFQNMGLLGLSQNPPGKIPANNKNITNTGKITQIFMELSFVVLKVKEK